MLKAKITELTGETYETTLTMADRIAASQEARDNGDGPGALVAIAYGAAKRTGRIPTGIDRETWAELVADIDIVESEENPTGS